MQELRRFSSLTHMDTFLDSFLFTSRNCSLFEHTRTELIQIQQSTGLEAYFPVIPYLTSTIKKGFTHNQNATHTTKKRNTKGVSWIQIEKTTREGTT